MTDGQGVVHRVAVVVNQRGLHARAAARIARVAGQFEAEVTVATTAEQVSALSIMGMLMLGASTGTELHFNGRGPDAEDAVDALARLVENGFEEEDFMGN